MELVLLVSQAVSLPSLNFGKIPTLPSHHSNGQIKAPFDFLKFRSVSALYKSISFLQRIHKCSQFLFGPKNLRSKLLFMFLVQVKEFINVPESRITMLLVFLKKKCHSKLKNPIWNSKQSVINTSNNSTYFSSVSTVTQQNKCATAILKFKTIVIVLQQYYSNAIAIVLLTPYSNIIANTNAVARGCSCYCNCNSNGCDSSASCDSNVHP